MRLPRPDVSTVGLPAEELLSNVNGLATQAPEVKVPFGLGLLMLAVATLTRTWTLDATVSADYLSSIGVLGLILAVVTAVRHIRRRRGTGRQEKAV